MNLQKFPEKIINNYTVFEKLMLKSVSFLLFNNECLIIVPDDMYEFCKSFNCTAWFFSVVKTNYKNINSIQIISESIYNIIDHSGDFKIKKVFHSATLNSKN